MRSDNDLVSALCALSASIDASTQATNSLRQWLKSHYEVATLKDLAAMEKRIMSVLSEFSGRVSAKFDEIGTAVDGIVADVAFLKKKIEELQNNPGSITPEDQAALDALEARVGTLTQTVKDLDAATEQPPVPPA